MKIEKFEKGLLFWNADDTECGVYDPDDELDGINEIGSIVEYEVAKRLPNFFGVDCGEGENGEAIYEYYDNEEEAAERAQEVIKLTQAKTIERMINAK